MRLPIALRILPALLFLCWGAAGHAAQPDGDGPGTAAVLHLQGAIGPAAADYIEHGFAAAARRRDALIVVEMDTPGGLDTAMRDIIHAILASPVPVVTYVAPSGARAASAGTYIAYASQVAAMAPGTNIGAASPVQIGPGASGGGGREMSTEERKMTNDAVAYIRSLAQLRGRNAAWAEQAVREAASLPAREALDKGVIDVMATNLHDLLRRIDGMTVEVHDRPQVLHTAGLKLRAIDPDWRIRALDILTDPTLAYILMLVGIYGLIYEFLSPGLVIPGVAGLICLLLALFAFQVLPINYAGLALILLGIAFMVGEAFMPSFGALGVGGAVAFIVGSVMLMDTDAPGFGISWYVIGAFTAASAGFLILVVGMLVRSRRRPVVSGTEEMIGARGEVVDDFTGSGMVWVHGELWQAHSSTPLRRGQPVTVVARDGLELTVEALDTEEH